jgi:hypothetical protein
MYAPYERAKGMRLPPTIATRLVAERTSMAVSRSGAPPVAALVA